MKIDLSGQRFGMLVAMAPIEERRHGYVMWRCRCDCGNEIVARGSHLRAGNTRSCGCVKKSAFRDVIDPLLDQGKSRREAACILGISPQTVTANRSRKYLGEKAKAAYLAGVIDSADPSLKIPVRLRFGGFAAKVVGEFLGRGTSPLGQIEVIRRDEVEMIALAVRKYSRRGRGWDVILNWARATSSPA